MLNADNRQTYYQNIARTWTFGLDASVNLGGLFVGVIDLYANLTRQQGRIVRNPALAGRTATINRAYPIGAPIC